MQTLRFSANLQGFFGKIVANFIEFLHAAGGKKNVSGQPRGSRVPGKVAAPTHPRHGNALIEFLVPARHGIEALPGPMPDEFGRWLRSHAMGSARHRGLEV